MQIINDNKNSKNKEIKQGAEQLKGRLEDGVIYKSYSNELKWLVQECLYLVRRKVKTDYYEELKIKENKKAEYSIMLMDGILNSHLKEI